jgi:ATP-dependent helicase/nuclease subunit A
VDHILVDEAQDTSPRQWEIIKAIAEEFFAGFGAERRQRVVQRTVFAVGDTKQSIMSFQGARPASFVETRAVVEAQAFGAKVHFERVPLVDSYRTAPNILSFVDEVFGDASACDGVLIDEEELRHVAKRRDMAGLVELWPSVKPPDLPEAEVWDAPKDRVSADHPAVTLAQTIAKRIAQWIGAGEPVFDKETKSIRPMTAGDVMILVRRRNLLTEEIIRQLKRRSIPVAGADRLKLAGHIAVMDLIALGRFALMPRDDLTLATVLKGPLCGLDDEALFKIAHGRKGTLWHALRDRAGEPAYADAVAFLRRVRGQADRLAPYEFYAFVLGEMGGWTKMLGRLGYDAADPIEEFLNAALDFEHAHTPSLEGFLHAIESTDTEIKRDQDRGEGAVRVMTVHASKGLEAPVVILPDTCTTPRHGRHDKDLLDAEAVPLWRVDSKRDEPVRARARAEGRDERMREYRRLLYVALTRARDRLYVCGYEGKDKREQGCWYDLVDGAMRRLDADKTIDETGEVFVRYGEVPVATAPSAGVATAKVPLALAPWVRAAAPVEQGIRHVEPSVAVRGRGAGGDGSGLGLERGRAIHRALEQLASAAPETWSAIATNVTGEFIAEPTLARTVVAEILRVRRDLLLSHIFGPGSYGEVPLRGLVEVGGEVVDLAARLDRVVVGEHDVLIVEYKTDRVVPKADTAIPPRYVAQLALYRLAVAQLFPGRPVKCAILWTAEARLSVLSSSALQQAVSALDPLHGAT